uniref:CSON001788 protein n=1 Tax=Culicoides sonorensis TaxID=179676 RepID=A0A336MLF7_CULSO
MTEILGKSAEEKYEYVLELLEKSEIGVSDGNVQLRRYLEQVKKILAERLNDEPHWSKISSEWLNRNINKLFGKNWEFLDFGLKLLGLLCRNESIFNDFLHDGVIQQVIEHHAKGELTDARLNHAYIVILRSMATHVSGLELIKQQQLWSVCFEEFKRTTIYLKRESARLLYDILLQLDGADDEMALKEVLKKLLLPLLGDIWLDSEHITVNDQENNQTLFKMLERLEDLLIMMFNSKQTTKLAYHLIVGFNLENKLWGCTVACVNQDFQIKLLRVLSYANVILYGYTEIPESDKTTQRPTVRQFYIRFYNMIGFCIQNRDPHSILMLNELTNHLCYCMDKKSPADIPGTLNLNFGDQVLILQLLPVLYKIKKLQCEKSQFLEEFCQKLFATSCEQTVRHMYAFRDVISQTSLCHGVIAVKSVKGLISMANYLSPSRGILVFQALVYILNEYVPATKTTTLPNGVRKVDLVLECSNLLSTIFNGLQTFVQKFNISWNDCVESTCIFHLSLTLLNNPGLSGRLSVQALNLVRIAIEHFLSPNMVLLMDNLEGSTMEKLGPTILKRLNDNESEVRDAAAELVTSIVEISKSKFPGFKKQILVNSICPMIVQLSETDRDIYVRASALKCLTNMVKIKQFWVHAFSSMNLLERLLQIVRREPEGIIRQEATGCLVAISAHQQLPPNIIDILFSTMSFLATNDLYYGVKIQAINFWSAYLEELFHNQGALDGKFPKETFSREHKKIVQLTPDQINRRLHKIIDSFSEKGGFGVLLAVLYDENDIEALKSCITLIQTLMNRLILYGFVGDNKKIDQNEDNADMKKSKFNSINGYNLPRVNDEDINLLAKAYAKLSTNDSNSFIYINGTVNESDEDLRGSKGIQIDTKYYEKFRQISGNEFIEIILRVNLDGILNAKSEWLQSSTGLESLLDDIILSFSSEKYEMDCY